jgi:hypothetical protein
VGCEGLLSWNVCDAVEVLVMSGRSGSVPHSDATIRGGKELSERGLEGIEGRGVSDGWVSGKARA